MRENKDFDGKGLPYPIKSPSDPVSIVMGLDKESALENITAIILKEISEINFEVGIYGDDEYTTYEYMEDGWEIEICIALQGRYVYDKGDRWTPPDEYFTKVWGWISDISVKYVDDDDETYDYSKAELEGLRAKVLKASIDTIHVC